MKKANYILFPFLIFKIFTITFLGTFLTYLGFEITPRLSGITNETKNIVFYTSCYSIIILIIVFYLLIYKVDHTKINNIKKYDYKNFSINLLVIQIFYTLYILLVDFKKLPYYYLIHGDLIQAAMIRMQIQTHAITIGIPYINKFIFFLSLFLPAFLFFNYLLSKNAFYLKLFILALILSLFNLSIDLEKSYFMLEFLILLFIYLYLKKVNYKLVFLLFIIILFFSYIILFLMNKDSIYAALMYIFDRLIFGQNQGLYYLYQYYDPNLKGLFSDFYFSSYLGLSEEKPDVYILGYIYNNLSHLVNANTYYLGESWAFFGWYGVLFCPFIVSINLVLYYYCFLFLMRYNQAIFFISGLIFFLTIPIDQSLQFIIYQKYFLYFIFFQILPFILLFKISKKGKNIRLIKKL
jgi:hypothetical protein